MCGSFFVPNEVFMVKVYFAAWRFYEIVVFRGLKMVQDNEVHFTQPSASTALVVPTPYGKPTKTLRKEGKNSR